MEPSWAAEAPVSEINEKHSQTNVFFFFFFVNFGPILRRTVAILGPSWPVLGQYLAFLVPLQGYLGAFAGHFGAVLGSLGAVLGRLTPPRTENHSKTNCVSTILGASWSHRSAFSGYPGPTWGHLGANWCQPGTVWGRLGAYLV